MCTCMYMYVYACVCMLIHVHVHVHQAEDKQLKKQNCISAQSYNVHVHVNTCKTIKNLNMYSNIYVHNYYRSVQQSYSKYQPSDMYMYSTHVVYQSQ